MSVVECFVVEFTYSDIMSLCQRQFDRLALIHTYLVVDCLYCFSGLHYRTYYTGTFAILQWRSHIQILCDLYINSNLMVLH